MKEAISAQQHRREREDDRRPRHMLPDQAHDLAQIGHVLADRAHLMRDAISMQSETPSGARSHTREISHPVVVISGHQRRLPGSRAASDHNGRMALQSACNQRRYPEAVPLRIITVGWHCTPKHVANVRLVALGLAFAATAPR